MLLGPIATRPQSPVLSMHPVLSLAACPLSLDAPCWFLGVAGGHWSAARPQLPGEGVRG